MCCLSIYDSRTQLAAADRLRFPEEARTKHRTAVLDRQPDSDDYLAIFQHVLDSTAIQFCSTFGPQFLLDVLAVGVDGMGA